MTSNDLVAQEHQGVCASTTDMVRGERKKGRRSVKESDVQAIAMQRQQQALVAALPQSIKGRRPSEILHALISDLERWKTFPEAPYVLGGKLLTPGLARLIESAGKHWVGQLEGRCPIQWEGPWRPLERVAEQLRKESPESFRAALIHATDGTNKTAHLFSRSVRLDYHGRRRIVILHEAADLTDTPVFLFTDALFWEGLRIVQLWQYRWDERLFF